MPRPERCCAFDLSKAMSYEGILKTRAKEEYLLSDTDLQRLAQQFDASQFSWQPLVQSGGRGMYGQQKQLYLVRALEGAAVAKHGSLEALRTKKRAKGQIRHPS